MTAATPLVVKAITEHRDLRDWINVPHTVFANNTAWIAPLHIQERQRVSERHNPFFQFGEAKLFVAYRYGKPIGRISAQVNTRHLAIHDDQCGHFGFFDCIDDVEVGKGLICAAAQWLKQKGMRQMRGPFNLSINEDIGLLVSGFDSPPSILTSYAPPWASKILEACGLSKEMDLFAYRMKPADAPPLIARLGRLATDSGRVRVRQLEIQHFTRELELIFDIFNDAWSENWGFVPFAPCEILAVEREIKPILRGKFGRIVDIDGAPAAMMVVLPDINRAMAGFNGRLLPTNWARLALAVLQDRWKTARIPLLGIRKQYQATPLAPAVLSLLVSEFLELGKAYNLDWVEFSWILETNQAMTKLAEAAAGPPSKIFRIYNMPLSSADSIEA